MMLNNIYVKLKTFIKENYKQIIFLVAFYIVMTYPLPYYIFVSGGSINVGERLEVQNGYSEEGSFGLAYVSEVRANIPTYLLSYIIPDWERVSVSNYQISDREDINDLINRDKIYLQEANQSAIYVAYTRASRSITIGDHHFLVYYSSDKANNSIKVGDEIISYDSIKLDNLSDFKTYINSKNDGDIVKLELKRNGESIIVDTPVFIEEGKKYVGIAFFDLFDYIVDPELKINFKDSESGPSGGFTLALAIYNRLVSQDITKGLKIVGTGTIDIDGTIGEIGGVKYKLLGAVKAKADVFIVPNGENYEECIKEVEKKGYSIQVIGVDNFDDALKKLKDL